MASVSFETQLTSTSSCNTNYLKKTPPELHMLIASCLSLEDRISFALTCHEEMGIAKEQSAMEWIELKKQAPTQLQQLMHHVEKKHGKNPPIASLFQIHDLLQHRLSFLPPEVLERQNIDQSKLACPKKILRMFSVLNDSSFLVFMNDIKTLPEFHAISDFPHLPIMLTHESTLEERLTFYENCSQIAQEIRAWMENHRDQLSKIPIDSYVFESSFVHPEISFFKKLKYLRLTNCDFPLLTSIVGLTNLEVLEVEDSRCYCVPEEVTNLTKLRVLSLRNCKLRSLPKSLSKLKRLRGLDLSCNSLREFPSQLGEISYLEHIDFSHNLLTKKPTLPENPHRRLLLDHNPISTSVIDRIKSLCSRLLFEKTSFDELVEIDTNNTLEASYEDQLTDLENGNSVTSRLKYLAIFMGSVSYVIFSAIDNMNKKSSFPYDISLKPNPFPLMMNTAPFFLCSATWFAISAFYKKKESSTKKTLQRRITQDAALDAAGY
jgi:Leucine-rich repeat (LRR) protein